MKTDPAPPSFSIPPRTDEDTGPTSQSQLFQARAAIAIIDALEATEETKRAVELARYAIDKTMGDVAEEEAKRVPTRLERIEEKLDRIIEMQQKRDDELMRLNAEVVQLKTWQRKHATSTHCDTCEFKHPEIEAREG